MTDNQIKNFFSNTKVQKVLEPVEYLAEQYKGEKQLLLPCQKLTRPTFERFIRKYFPNKTEEII